ncbi:MAG: 50S ribosomal protein L25 [Planctomycetes bacterium]|nr:50S ribosomal protein L25 [Planctomycetota bacterium]
MTKRGEYVLQAEKRDSVGTRACRRMRGLGLVPANLYGHGLPNVNLRVSEKDFLRYFHEGHRMLTLEFEGGREVGLVKEVQYDPVTDRVLHVDFSRVSLQEVVEVAVPIVTRGVPKGVQGGGVLDHVLRDVTVRGKAFDVPENVMLPIGELELDAIVRVKDLAFPEGCQVLADPEAVVLHIRPPEEEEEAAAAPVAEGESAEPELVRRKRKEEEAEEDEGKGGKKGGQGA